jgi:hypothetical protein
MAESPSNVLTGYIYPPDQPPRFLA